MQRCMTEANSAESLAAFLTPDETAAQLLQRITAQPLLTAVPFIDRRTRLRPNHLVLISGTCSSCKTELLIQVIQVTPTCRQCSRFPTLVPTSELLHAVCRHMHPAHALAGLQRWRSRR